MCMSAGMAKDRVLLEKLMESVREFIKGGRKGWNKEVTTRVGLPLLEGITQYFDGDYSSAVTSLSPIMDDLQQSIEGSKAQKDVFRQILLQAAVESGKKEDIAVAKQVLSRQLEESGLPNHKPVNKRI